MSIKIKNEDIIGQGNSELIKTFLKRLLYIGLCLIPIFVLANNKGNIRLVSLPILLIGIYQLIMIIALSLHIIEKLFSPKQELEKSNSFERFMFALFVVGVIFIFVQITNFDNTINGTKLIWTACAVGIGLAITLTIILKIIRHLIFFESNARYIVLFVGLSFLISVLFGFINYHYAENKTNCKTYTIIRKDSYGIRATSYFIYVKLDGDTEKEFSIGKKRYNNFNKDETVEICIAKGLFGFDFAADFNKTNK